MAFERNNIVPRGRNMKEIRIFPVVDPMRTKQI